MKALFLLTIVLVASTADAGFLSGLKNVFSSVGKVFATTGKALLGQLDNVGGSLLSKVTEAGKNLLSQGLQSLALNTMGAMKGRREVNGLVEKLTNFEKEVTQEIDTGMEKFHTLLSNVINSFDQVIEKVKDLINEPTKIVEMIDNLTGFHNGLADLLLNDLVTKVDVIATNYFSSHKRNAFTDAIKSIAAQLSTVFKPAVEGFKNMVHTTGTALKAAATNIVSTVHNSVNGLGQSLSGIIDNHVLEIPTIN